MEKVLKRPAAQVLKRPASSDLGPPAKKRPAAAIWEEAGVHLAERAPVYLPSKRPKPEEITGDRSREPPRAQRKCAKDASFKQSSLRALMSQTPPLLQLHLCGGGIDKPAVLDFNVAGFALPALRDLVVENWPLKSGNFEENKFPNLRSLQIRFPFDGEPGTPDDWNGFKVALPELRDLVLERPGSIQSAELKASTQACPNLTYLCLYKVFVERLSVVLPSAQFVWLHRLEDLKSVSVYGPRLKELRLQACYDLKQVKILERAPGVAAHAAAPLSNFVVDLTNSHVPQQTIEDLREHPRVKYVVVPSDEDSISENEEEGEGCSTFKIGHFMKAPGMDRMQLECMMGLTRFGEEVGVDVYEKVREGRSISVKQMARLLEWGARVVYIWWEVQVSTEALALAKQACVPVQFWDQVTAKEANGRNSTPFLLFVNDMRKRIKEAGTRG